MSQTFIEWPAELRSFIHRKGGAITYNSSVVPQVVTAVETFSATNSNPDADIVAGFQMTNGSTIAVVQLFYNGAQLPTTVFADFLSIPSQSRNVGTIDFLNFTKTISAPYLNENHLRYAINLRNGATETNRYVYRRGMFNTVPIPNITAAVMGTIIAEGEVHGSILLVTKTTN
jgi:hypothetical protein